MPDGLALAPGPANDALDDLAELHLDPRPDLNEPDRLGLALLRPAVVSRQLDLARALTRARVGPLGLRVAFALGSRVVAVRAETKQVVRDVLIVGQVELAPVG